MALTFTEANSTSNKTSEASTSVGSITASIGDVVEVKIAADNAGTNGASSISSVTDSAGNTYTQQVHQNNDPGAANEGVTFAIYTATITSALSGGTVTVNFSPNTTAKAVQVTRIQPGAGETVSIIAADGTTGTGTTYAAPTVSVTNGDTISAGAAIELNLSGGATPVADSDTTNGNWSTQWLNTTSGGGAAANVGLISQRKTVNATGNQTYDPTGNSADWAAGYVIYRSAVVATGRFFGTIF